MFESYSEIGGENIIAVDILAGIGSFIVVAIGATVIGVLHGLVAAFISRYTNEVRVIEPLVVFVMGYLSYLSAELFHLSGILSWVLLLWNVMHLLLTFPILSLSRVDRHECLSPCFSVLCKLWIELVLLCIYYVPYSHVKNLSIGAKNTTCEYSVYI